MARSKQPVSKRAARTRSAVTNGRRMFVDADGRSLWARRWTDLFSLHADDLGGVEGLSEAEKSILRRVVSLEVELERMECTLASGGVADVDMYSRLANTCRRLLETLGIKRRVKDVTPSLADIIREHNASKAAEQAEERVVRDVPVDPLPRTQTPSLFDDDAREAAE